MDLRQLGKPYYVYRPQQLVRRARLRGSHPVVATPWSRNLQVNRNDAIGDGIARTGVYELATGEALWRLTAADDVAVDVGANIGFITSLFAVRAARVVAFEPNPAVREELVGNVARWSDAAKVTIDGRALSRSAGTARLFLPESKGNAGLASLEGSAGPSVEVEATTLAVAVPGAIGVLKVDVEGHELAVLEGADLELIRDLVFEEHNPLPSLVSELLERAGFAIFPIGQTFRGPTLGGAVSRESAPNVLATRKPQRAMELLRPRGWQSLRGHA